MNIREEIIHLVKNQIERMPVKYKMVALLWYFEELTILDIANILNIPEEIVEIRIEKVESVILPTVFSDKQGNVIYKRHHQQFFIVVSQAFDLIIESYKMPKEVESRVYGNIMDTFVS